MNEWPTRVRTGVPPFSRMISGTALRADQVVHDRLARVLRSRMPLATIAVVVEPLTGWPRSSTRNTRSASPSNARPTSAPPSSDRALQVLEVLDLDRVGRVVRERAVELAEQDRERRTAGRRTPSARRGHPCRWRCRRRPAAAAARRRSTNERTCVGELVEQVAAARPCPATSPRRVTPDATISLICDEPGLLADRRGAGPAQLDAVVLRRVVARGEHRGRARRGARRRSTRGRSSTGRGRRRRRRRASRPR